MEKQYATNVLVRSQTGIDSELDPSELLSEIKDINSVKEVSTISLNGFATMLQDDDHVDFDYVLTDLKELEEQRLLLSSPKNVHNSTL